MLIKHNCLLQNNLIHNDFIPSNCREAFSISVIGLSHATCHSSPQPKLTPIPYSNPFSVYTIDPGVCGFPTSAFIHFT